MVVPSPLLPLGVGLLVALGIKWAPTPMLSPSPPSVALSRWELGLPSSEVTREDLTDTRTESGQVAIHHAFHNDSHAPVLHTVGSPEGTGIEALVLSQDGLHALVPAEGERERGQSAMKGK